MSQKHEIAERRIDIGAGRSVSAVIGLPSGPPRQPVTTVILAHGAGNDMHTPFLSAVHEGMAARGYAAVKFNFPYTEIGRRAPDPASVLEACYQSVLAAVRANERLAPGRIVIGGKSLGGRMATHLAAGGAATAGVVLLGYPLHPPGRTDKLRVAHLARIRVPMLFFAGTRDALCQLDLLRQTLQALPAPTTLHVIDGGDHSFNLPKRMQRDAYSVWDEIVAATADWINALPAQ